MFCSKCGFDAGNSKACPKCGNPIVVKNETDRETKQYTGQVVFAQPEVPKLKPIDLGGPEDEVVRLDFKSKEIDNNEKETQEVMPNEVRTESVPSDIRIVKEPDTTQSKPRTASRNMYENGIFTGHEQPVAGVVDDEPVRISSLPKRNKKKGIKIAVLTAVLIAVCVGGYFAYPYVIDFIAPKVRAVSALKSAGKDLNEYVSDTSTTAISSVGTQTEYKGILKINSVNFNGNDELANVKVNKIGYDVQYNSITEEAGGIINLLTDDGTIALSADFYSDMKQIYFRVPDLFSETFSVSLTSVMASGISGNSTSAISSGLSSTSGISASNYSSMATALAECLVEGYNELVDNCKYTRTGSENFNSISGTENVAEFKMTITGDAIEAGAEKFVDAVYDNSTFKTYTGLLEIMENITRDSIKSEIKKATSDLSSYDMNIYVNNKKELVKLKANISDVVATCEFKGKDSLYDVAVFNVANKDNSMTFGYDFSGSSKKIDAVIDTSTNGTKRKIGVHTDIAGDADSAAINNYSMEIDSPEMNASFAISGDMKSSTYEEPIFSASTYKNSIDLENITTDQGNTLIVELVRNVSVLERVMSESLYKNVFGLN